jgi:hypothetical protein
MEWIYLAGDRSQGRTAVDTTRTFGFLVRLATLTFLRILLHGISYYIDNTTSLRVGSQNSRDTCLILQRIYSFIRLRGVYLTTL